MYLDACIVVKLLTAEPDSLEFDQRLQGESLSTSELALAEVASALLAKERAGALAAPDRVRAWRQFKEWIASEEILLAPLDSPVLRKAVRLLEHCHPAVPLRTLDALHLATADISMDTPFCTTDRRLRDAAERLGFELFPPS